MKSQLGDLSAQTQAVTYVDASGTAHSFILTKVGVTKNGVYKVAGIGIGAETQPDGSVLAQVLVEATRFAIIDSASGYLQACFVAENGQIFIGYAWITNSMIGNVIQSNNYNGTVGWRITKDGTAYFGGDVTVRGNVNAGSITGQFQASASISWSGDISSSGGGAAARQLDIPLPTVSRHLAELEARIGAKILLRSSRKLTLTEAGAGYVESIRLLLEQLREIEQAAANAHREPKGTLTMTAPVVMGRTHLVPLVAEFLRAHPQIDIRLILADQILPMIERQFDLALRVGHLPDSALIATEVGVVRRVAVASPAFLAEHGVPRLPEDLARMDCVTFDNLTGSDAWRFQVKGAAKAVPVRSRLVVTTAEAALAASELGLGVTRLLSYQVSDSVANGRLRVVLQSYDTPWPVSLVYPAQNLVPHKLIAFLNYAAPRLRERFAAETALFTHLARRPSPAT